MPYIRDTISQHWVAMLKRIESDNAGLLANHYLNEALLQFYEVARRTPPPPALIALLEPPQLAEYEAVWQREVRISPSPTLHSLPPPRCSLW